MTVASLLREIDSVYHSHQEENWDGYGAKPITKESTDGIKALLGILPERVLRDAEIGCDPDGCMNIEWYYYDNNGTISVSASGEDSFDLAAVFRWGNCHGKFTGIKLHPIVLTLIDWVKD